MSQVQDVAVTVRLDKADAEKLEEIRNAAPYKIPKSEIVRTALREHFERQEAL